MSIYSGLGVAASVREARLKQQDEGDGNEAKDLPMREELLLASLRKQVGGKAALQPLKRMPQAPIDWRSPDALAGQDGRIIQARKPVEAPPGWSKGSWSPSQQNVQRAGQHSTAPGDKRYLSKAERRKARKAAVIPLLNDCPPGGVTEVVADVVSEFSSGKKEKNAFRAIKRSAAKGAVAGSEQEDGAAERRQKRHRPEPNAASQELAAFAVAQVPSAVDAMQPAIAAVQEARNLAVFEGGEVPEYPLGLVVLLKQRADAKSANGKFPRGHVAAIRERLSVGGPVTFVDIVPNSLNAYIRFDSAKAATKALSVRGLGELSAVCGDVERQYWARAAKKAAEQQATKDTQAARKAARGGASRVKRGDGHEENDAGVGRGAGRRRSRHGKSFDSDADKDQDGKMGKGGKGGKGSKGGKGGGRRLGFGERRGTVTF